MERKGAMTPEQEAILDKIIKLKGIAEALDGPAISIIDNQGIDRLLAKATPEVKDIVYQVVDMIFLGLSSILDQEG